MNICTSLCASMGFQFHFLFPYAAFHHTQFAGACLSVYRLVQKCLLLTVFVIIIGLSEVSSTLFSGYRWVDKTLSLCGRVVERVSTLDWLDQEIQQRRALSIHRSSEDGSRINFQNVAVVIKTTWATGNVQPYKLHTLYHTIARNL
jgi:hypothetical protein